MNTIKPLRHGWTALLALLLALVVGVTPLSAQEATPTGPSLLGAFGYPELRITTNGADFTPPTSVTAGRYRIVLENTTDLSADLELYQLPEGITIDDLLAFFEDDSNDTPDWLTQLVSAGGATAAPGEAGEVIVDLAPGEWTFNLFTYEEDEEESDADTDTAKTVMVTGEAPPAVDPAVAAEITMVDHAFQMPTTIAAGPQVWKIANEGAQAHHMIGVRVPDGTTVEQVVELASSFFGPPATPEAATAEPAAPALAFEDVEDAFEALVLSPGQANWVQVDLEPGTYAARCFITDLETGLPHVMLGMAVVFTVA